MVLKAFRRSVRAENKKLRGGGVWAVFLLIPLLSAAYGTFSFCYNSAAVTQDWAGLWGQHTLYYALFFFAPMAAIYAAWLWRLEHLGHNWALVMGMPVPRPCLFAAKLAAAFRLVLLTQGWMWLLFFGCGKLWARLPGTPPPACLLWALRGALAAVPMLALQLLFSMLCRSFVPPVLLALLGGVAGFLFVSKGWGLYWPYGLPALGMNANQGRDMLGGQALPFAAACLGFTLLFTAAAALLLQKWDVRG